MRVRRWLAGTRLLPWILAVGLCAADGAGGEEVDRREVDLEPGDFLHAVVVQHGADVSVRLVDPTGETVWTVDSPNATEGPEELFAIVESGGRYRIEVTAPPDTPAGQFTFEKPVRRRPAADDRDRVAADRAYHRGRQLAKEKRHREAAAEFVRALGTFEQLGVRHWEAHALYGLCSAHQELNELPAAIAFCDRAAELYREVDDRRMAAAALDRAGLHHLWLGHPSRALRYFEEALPLFEEVGFDRGAALCLLRLGTVYKGLGKIRDAFDALQRAEERVGDRVHRLRGHIMISLGDVFLALHQVEKAQDRYSAALDLYRQLDNFEGIPIALRAYADTTSRLGQHDAAVEILRAALPRLEASTSPRSRALTKATLGRILHRAGQLKEARTALEEALELSLEAADPRVESFLRVELGYVLSRDVEPAAGLGHLDHALEIFIELGDTLGEASARARGAEILRDLGRPAQAWERMAPALDLIEGQRAQADRSDVRSTFFAARQDYYEIAIDILMRLHERDTEAGRHREAFTLHERRLARELRDRLDNASPELEALEPALLREETDLEARLRKLASLPPETPGREEGLGKILEELHRVWGEMQRIAAPVVRSSMPLGLEEIQEGLLDADSLLLAFALGEERSFLWSISREGIDVHVLASRRHLETLAGDFTELSAASISFQASRLRRAGLRLRDALLSPVARELGDHRLVVVPDGALGSIPFAALPGEDGDYLVRRHEIVVLPSVSTLALLRRAEARRPRRDTLALFADPVLSADRFAHLPDSRAEVEAILALAPPGRHVLATGFEASRERFLDLAAEEYRVLHFATHAVPDPERPELTGLVLSQVDAQGQPRNGHLRAWEIARLDLPVELVNLSACQTVTGPELRGEGSMGLARAFLDAGASRVVASLWPVSDRDTAALMTRFYDGYLNRGLAPAAALRAAQLELLADTRTAAPRSWAAFVLQGDWRPSPGR